MIAKLLLLSFFCVLRVQSQENAARYIARSLMECYNTTENFARDHRPPADINVLIALIRKIENDGSVQNDRMLSTEIIHRFKQDGIVRSLFSNLSSYSIPYSPKGFQADKHRIYLTKLVPGSAAIFPNNSLNANERCSLHFMLSNSIDRRLRGDETLVCKKLNRYQMRSKRSSDPKNDVEILEEIKASPLRDNLEEDKHETVNDNQNTETFDVDSQNPSNKVSVSVPISDCPVENGVVFSKWGAFQAGTVIAAIAAGRAPQIIEVESHNMDGEKKIYKFSNIYAATLAGDLSEVALRQGSLGLPNVFTGNRGDFNNRLIPTKYYLEKYTQLEMTDAEIRAGLDGLIIACKIEEWKNKASSLKISQILDMYYSDRGILSAKKYRACNRKILFNEVVNSTALLDETTAFSFLLNRQSSLDGSITDEGIISYSKKAVEHFKLHIASIDDFGCDNSNSKIVRANTDILIILDTKWEYNVVQPAISYLLNNIDITPYNSNFTIINGKDGNIIVKNSNSILDFYRQYNKTKHSQNQKGFDVTRSFETIQSILNKKAEINGVIKKASLQSSIVLFMPFDPLSSSDQQTAESYKGTFRNNFPDLKLLVLGQNSKQTHGSLVLDVGSDAFDLPDTTDTAQITERVSPAALRIQQEPTRIVHPACKSTESSSGTSTISFDQYVDPRGVNYHRISPIYFHQEESRTIKIRNSGYGNLIGCMSRKMVNANENSTDMDCKPLVGVSVADFDLPSSCDDVTSCPPVYIIVKAGDFDEKNINARCTDNGCRFPDNLKYSIEINSLDCSFFSGSNIIALNVMLPLLMLYILKLIL